MYSVTLQDGKSSKELRECLGLANICDCIQSCRLRWFGHVERMEDVNWVKKSREFMVAGRRGRGKPQKTWDEVVRGDLTSEGIDRVLALNRAEWKRVCRLSLPSNPC